MKAGSPRIFAAVDYRANPDRMWIDPLNLQDGEVEIVAEQFRKVLVEASSGNWPG
jgi:hypothetical protein